MKPKGERRPLLEIHASGDRGTGLPVFSSTGRVSFDGDGEVPYRAAPSPRPRVDSTMSEPEEYRRTGRTELHDLGLCRVFGPPLLALVLCLGTAAVGVRARARERARRRARARRGSGWRRVQVLLLLPEVTLPGVDRRGSDGRLARWINPTGIGLVLLGCAGPFLLVCLCTWWQRPSAAARQRMGYEGGTMLHEVLRGRNVATIYDVLAAGTGELTAAASGQRGAVLGLGLPERESSQTFGRGEPGGYVLPPGVMDAGVGAGVEGGGGGGAVGGGDLLVLPPLSTAGLPSAPHAAAGFLAGDRHHVQRPPRHPSSTQQLLRGSAASPLLGRDADLDAGEGEAGRDGDGGDARDARAWGGGLLGAEERSRVFSLPGALLSAGSASEAWSGSDAGSVPGAGALEDAGAPTIVILPGAGVFRALLRPVARAIAKKGFRVVLMDLPGGGSLAAVPWSLRACEQAIHAVVDREACLAGNRVVLLAWGAATYCAASAVLRDARRFAGLICAGAVPDYVGLGPFAGTEAAYRLDWLRWLENERCRAEVLVLATAAGHHLAPQDRNDVVGVDFNPAVIPTMIDDLNRRSLLQDLREVRKPVWFVGPRAWVSRAQELVPVSNVRVVRVRGIRDPIVPPLSGRAIEDVAAAVHRAVSAVPRELWTMTQEEVLSVHAEARGVASSVSYSASGIYW